MVEGRIENSGEKNLGPFARNLWVRLLTLRILATNCAGLRTTRTLQRAAQEAQSRVGGLHRRLRLTSKSVSTQEAARWLVHCGYYQWRSTQGDRGDFWQAQEGIRTWLAKFYVAARKELGLEGSPVYQDPPEGLPIPGDTH